MGIYLAGSEAAFRYQNLAVFQIQMTKRFDTLPIIREYMVQAERRLAAHDGRLGHVPSRPEQTQFRLGTDSHQ